VIVSLLAVEHARHGWPSVEQTGVSAGLESENVNVTGPAVIVLASAGPPVIVTCGAGLLVGRPTASP